MSDLAALLLADLLTDLDNFDPESGYTVARMAEVYRGFLANPATYEQYAGLARSFRDLAALDADPLRPPETDSEPSCCEYACYEDPGCSCPGCVGQRSVEVRNMARTVAILCLVGMVALVLLAARR